MEFTVHVVHCQFDDEEKPRPDTQVTVFDNRQFWSTGHLSETTDDNGIASFDCDWQTGEWDGSVKIFVGNQEGEEFTVNDGDSFTIRYDYD